MALPPLLFGAAPSGGPGADAALVATGLGAGVINGVAGGGTLLSFPALLGLGYPPLAANVTSTVGIWPGYLGGAAGFGPEVADQRQLLARLAPAAVAGAAGGSALLLTTPATTFAAAAPWLVLAASVLYALQPLVARWLGRHATARRRQRALLVGTLVASLYGGYFGAGLGVVLLALLGLTVPQSVARTTGLRTAVSVAVNGVAAAIFLGAAPVALEAAGLLALGSLVGGVAGARAVRRLPAGTFRAIVVLVGLATVAKLLA